MYQSLFHMEHMNLIAVDGSSITEVCNYIGDITLSDINILCPTPIDSPSHEVHFYSNLSDCIQDWSREVHYDQSHQGDHFRKGEYQVRTFLQAFFY